MADDAFSMLGISLPYLRECVSALHRAATHSPSVTSSRRFVDSRGGDAAFEHLTTSQVQRAHAAGA